MEDFYRIWLAAALDGVPHAVYARRWPYMNVGRQYYECRQPNMNAGSLEECIRAYWVRASAQYVTERDCTVHLAYL